jgi:DNA-directed RNA polymerase subunit L
MKLNFVEDEAKSLIVEFEDVDRSVPEIIKSKLIDNKDVEFVGVAKEHPDIAKSKLVVKSSKNARSIVLKAVEDLQDDIKEISSKLPKK